MSDIKRRHFLQFAGSTLATLGLSQFDFFQQSENYTKVLAQNTQRKLALLVGVNEYSFSPLYGCVNDVMFQRELLIYRFGFKPQDIVTLTDAQATRQNMLAAFEEHLIKQAKPNDVVLFHFSGHGARVSDKPDCDSLVLKLSNECENSTILPVDARSGGAVRDIMGHTLFLLMSALKTENVTVVLDSCHSGGGKRGNLRIRSYDLLEIPQPSQEEFEYQRKLLGQLGLSKQEFINRRRKAIAKGVVIASAKREQFAVDARFNDFSAGAFSYIFTQYLWQQTGNESFNRSLVNVSRSTQIYARQQGQFQTPEFESNVKKPNPLMYFTPLNASPAEAVITKTNGNEVELWLGGVDSQSLEAFDKDALFSVVDASGKERALVKLVSRQGLMGRGTLLNKAQQTPLQPGTFLQERIRSIPNDITLKIGLDDSSLDSNTAQKAKQALQAIKRIEAKALGTAEVQYIFGGMTDARIRELQKRKVPKLPEINSFGLFLSTLDGIIPDSFGKPGESIEAAVNRLKPKLKSLLAARLVKQMLGNTNTSRLSVTATMTIAGSQKVVGETFPIRGVTKTSPTQPKPKIPAISQDGNISKLRLGTQIVFEIRNNESVPIYVSILVIDAAGDMAIIYPNDWSASERATLVESNRRLVVPEVGVDTFKLTVSEPVGFSEALIIASTTPLRDSLKALKDIAISRGINTRSPIAVADDELLNVASRLLDDLDAGTRGGITAEGVQIPTGVRGVDTKKLAAMSIPFEVVG